MNPLDIEPPTEEALTAELKNLRRVGLVKLSQLETPALNQAVRACGRIEQTDSMTPFAIERLLRDVVVTLGSDLGEAAATLYGLGEEGRSARPSELRKAASEYLGVGTERLRQHYEPLIFTQLAQLILAEIYNHRLKLSQLQANVRTPIGSRLAVEWLHRFEAMYNIWTPITGLGNELTAYRSTLLEPDRPWDRDPNPDDPDDDGYTQELQAAGYITDAFYHFTRFQAELQDFQTKFGGLWLLPDAQAETDLRDAAHRIKLASPQVTRDDSHLRMILNQVPNREFHGFLNLVKNDTAAMETHWEWHDWAATCECAWTLGERKGREAYPTHLNHPKISDQCDMHILITACNDYVLTLDDAWDHIADWYQQTPKPQRVDRTPEEIYVRRNRSLFKHLKT